MDTVMAYMFVYGGVFAIAYFIGFVIDLFQRVALDKPRKIFKELSTGCGQTM